MDHHKNHLVIYLHSTLFVLIILCLSSIESIYSRSYSLSILLVALFLQAFFSKRYLLKTQSSDFPFYLWILCGCLIPFSKFYSHYTDDVYFLVMNCFAGICVGKLLSGICDGMSQYFESIDELALANESKLISKALAFLPVTFVVVLVYLLMNLQSGLNGLLLVGDLTLVTKFPVIMMLGAMFPIILIWRALKIIDKREKKND